MINGKRVLARLAGLGQRPHRLAYLVPVGIAFAAYIVPAPSLMDRTTPPPDPVEAVVTADFQVPVSVPTPAPMEEAAPEQPAPTPAPTAAPTDEPSARRVRIYRVVPGDTLADIAARNGLQVDTLIWSNKISDPSMLQPGQPLRIPPADGVLYTLQPGDTLRAIAERTGVSVEKIVAANGLTDADQVAAGTEVLVPGASPSALPATAQSDEGLLTAAAIDDLKPIEASSGSRPRGLRVHVVAEGDSLASVASAYGLSVPTLVWANNLQDRPDRLAVGEQLLIPSTDGAVYTIQEGESLHEIASKFRVSYKALLDANDYPNPDLVGAGTWIVIPGVDPRVVQAPLSGQPAQAAAGAMGQKPLQAQARATNAVYEVQPGDTLTTLANKFGVDLKTILAANGISNPNLITVGTKLKILPVSGVEHVVKPGETLADIAARYRTDLGVIVDFNGISDPNVIQPGTTLILPGGRQPVAPAPAPAPAPAAPVPAPRPAPAPPPVPVPASSLGQTIANFAAKFEGYPYVWGGTSPSGFDCSGLVYYVFQQVGRPISRGLWGQYNSGRHVSRDQLQPGDIVFFQNTYMPGLSHNGIYLGGGRFIHAVEPGKGVRISSIYEPYYASRWFGATRVM